MFKQVYVRSLHRKPACRRHLFPDSVYKQDRQPLLPGLCLCDLNRQLGVELWNCGFCGPDWLAYSEGVFVCPLPSKKTKESLASSSGSSAKKSTTFDSFPELWDFLTSPVSPDGDKRPGGKLSLSCEQGTWSLVLSDPLTSLYACLSSPDLDDLILMAEARLSESTMPWRTSQYARSKK